MLDYLTNVPFLIGVALLAAVAVMIWRKPSDSQPVTIIFLAGLALIVLSDDRILNLKFSASGVEVTRKDLAKAEVNVADQIAKINSELAQQKKAVEALTKQATAPRPADAGTPALATPALSPEFQENSKFTILVYYRDNAEGRSSEVVAKLVAAGFKSARVNTDLTEVGRLLPSGSVRVRFNDGRDQVAKRVAAILTDDAKLDAAPASRTIPGDIQVLLY